MQRDTARLAASGANETAGPAPLEQERRAPRLVRKRFLKLGKRTPPRHRSFIPAIPHGRLDHSHTICSSYLSQRDKPFLRNPDRAGEALQEAYVRIWTQAGRYDPLRGPPMHWMTSIVRHVSIDAVRHY